MNPKPPDPESESAEFSKCPFKDSGAGPIFGSADDRDVVCCFLPFKLKAP